MSVIEINKRNFETIISQKGKTILIDFFADWCAPCRMISPLVEEIAEEAIEEPVEEPTKGVVEEPAEEVVEEVKAETEE